MSKKISSDERKKEIISKALEYFSQEGFHGTTTKALANHCGVSEALLFQHFPNKDKLYEEILRSKCDDTIPDLLAGLGDVHKTHETLATLAERILRQHDEDPSFLRLLLYSSLENHGLSELFFQKRQLHIADFLLQYFTECLEKKTIRKVEPEKLAHGFMSIMVGFLLGRLVFKVPHIVDQPIEEWSASLVDIFMKGISL